MSLDIGFSLASRPASQPLSTGRGTAAASWWSQGAVIDADYAGGRYYYSGNTYADETALNTAIGASKSGITRTIGPYIVGTEMTADGTFSSGIDSWGDSASYAANGDVSYVSSGLRLTYTGSGTLYRARRSFTSVADRAYVASLEQTAHNGLTGSYISCSTNEALGGAVSNQFTLTSLPQTKSVVFSPQTSPMYIGTILTGAASGTTYGQFDNFSVKEAYPFNGYVPRASAVRIKFTTPSSVPSAVVLTQWGDDSERTRIRVVLNTDLHLHVITTRNNTQIDDLDLGLLVVSTDYTLNLNMALSHLLGEIVGMTPQIGTGSSLPGVGKIWIGRSYTGETWTGDIKRVTIWPFERNINRSIWVEGDSYVAGSGGVGLTTSLNASRIAITTGVGGTAIDEQYARVAAAPGLGHTGIYVHWDGSASSALTLSQSMGYYEGIINRLNHTRFVIIPPVRLAAATVNNNTIASQTQAAIAARWPNNYIDAQAILASHATSPGDDSDVSGNYVPDSLLQVDNTHLTSTGMGYISDAVLAFLTAKGW